MNSYNGSLYSKCLKLYKKTALVAEDWRVPQIQRAAQDPELEEFDKIFTRDFSEAADCSFEEYMQKLCIMNHLFKQDVELYIHYGHGSVLFNQLWGGKFVDKVSSSSNV